MDKKLAMQKKGILTDQEIRKIVDKWKDEREEEELDPKIIEKEVERLKKKFQQYNVPWVGHIPEGREDGNCRIMYCQLNSCSGKEIRELKVEGIMKLRKQYDVNIAAMAEIGFRFDAVESSRSLATWFDDSREVRATSSNNVHDPGNSKHQQGGTGIVCFNEFLQYARTKSKDPRRLGRWCSWSFWATPAHRFRLIMAYNTGERKPKGLKTIYQQQLRYVQERNITKTPSELFCDDLCKQCYQWRKAGDRLLLFMDANEHVTKGNLFLKLAADGIHLEEFSHKYWGTKPPHTFLNGSLPIDGAYKTKDVEIANFALLPFSISPGDHRTFMLDVTTRSMLGEFLHRAVRPVSRRLVTSNKRCVANYTRITEEQFDIHRIDERLTAIQNLVKICGYPIPQWLEQMAQKLYTQMDEISKHSEKKCRKILRPASEYSLPIQYWYDKIHAYENLITLKEGTKKYMNKSGVIKFAKKHMIESPHTLTVDECKDGLRFARIQQRRIRRQAKGLRRAHMRDCLLTAITNKKEEAVKEIKQKINREQTRSHWRSLQKTTKDPPSPPLLRVQTREGNQIRTHNDQASLESGIQGTCMGRFTMAHSAAIMKHFLGDKLRYLSDRDIASQIIEGTYDIPTDLDRESTLILEEIGRMGVQIINGDRPPITITPEDFTKFWKRVNEFTSSGGDKHYGHYKASLTSDRLVKIYTQQLTIVSQSGVPPNRWKVCIQVMLEKIAGVCLVEKLRAIQLYDAQYNHFQHFVFGQEAMKTLTENGFLPEEHFSQKGSTAEDAKFDKTLMYDLSRQARQPMGVSSVDASNCYDRVNHIIMSLVWLSLLGDYRVIYVALLCIQTMKFFQRSGFGDSITYFGGSDLIKYIMGLGQGSRGAPPSWLQISSVIVNIQRALGYGAKVIDPITKFLIHTIGALFVDDTDLYTWDINYKTGQEVYDQHQKELNQWTLLLNATGGALSAQKCWTYLLDYECVAGEWKCTQMADVEITIPNPDGSSSKITLEELETGKKTLGVWDNPLGGNEKHCDVIHDKMETWVNRMKNGRLPSHIAWLGYRLQLWTGIRYGIGTMTNELEKAQEVLANLDYEMLPILGIARTIKTGWRRLHTTFGGFGLLNFPTEQLICRLNLLLQHYHTSSMLSRKLDASLHYLQLQLGTPTCPLYLDYDKWGFLSPLCWVKVLWRTLKSSELEMHIQFADIPSPRRRDQVIMEIVHERANNKEEILSMSRCKGALKCMFLSDIVTADGRKLEHYVFDPGGDSFNSAYHFPREQPTDKDWEQWSSFWKSYTDEGGVIPSPLEQWQHPSHRLWEWFYEENEQVLYQIQNDNVHYFIPATRARTTRSQNTYRLAWTEKFDATKHTGKPVSIIPKEDNEYLMLQTGPQLVTNGPSQPDNFWDFLYEWGGEWMWENISTDQYSTRDLTWLVEGMKTGSLIFIADGSYNREKAPKISGTGWIVYCTTAKRKIQGSFYEDSKAASSYRGELLGMCCLLLLATALEEFFDIQEWTAQLSCDNESALYQATRGLKRIRPGASCADLLRSIRSSGNRLNGKFIGVHVDSHMDKYLLWHQLTLEQQLNVLCDQLAKGAVSRAILDQMRRRGRRRDGLQVLPREDVALFSHGEKLTSDIAKTVRYSEGRKEAKEFLTTEKKWSEEQFEEVDWDWLTETIEKKPDMYKVWLSKQHTGHCGTRAQVAYYSGLKEHEISSNDVGCPNCGMKETAAHLCVCPNEDRTRLLKEMVDDFETWMNKNDATNREIAYWVPKYILFRGTKKFEDLGPMSAHMKEIARSQDIIGWRNFMEGRISKKIYHLQRHHLTTTQLQTTGEDWIKQFITRLLHITHSQWVFRNFSLHDHQRGLLRRNKREEIFAEIEQLADTSPDEVPAESRFLLEFDLGALGRADLDTQLYWVAAVRAARCAGRRRARAGARARRLAKSRRRRISLRTRLGIPDVERQIRRDFAHCAGTLRQEQENVLLLSQPAITSFSRTRPHPASLMATLKSNKRLRKPD